MTEFKIPPKKQKAPTQTVTKKIPKIIDQRCKVCASGHRELVDELLVAGVSYSEIERQFEFASIPRRSIGNHAHKHLGYQEAAVREIIEREAEAAQRNYEDGVQRLVTNNTYTEVALNKAFEQIMRDDIEISVGEAVKLIELRHKLESQATEEAIDELRFQFQAFMQSVKEIAPRDLWERMRDRTHEIVNASGRGFSMDAPKVIEAQAVDVTSNGKIQSSDE